MTSTRWDELFGLVDVRGDFDDPSSAPRIPKRPGRPRGRKTTPKESIDTTESLKVLVNRMQPFLNEEQKEYWNNVINGKQNVDCLEEMKLLVRQISIIFHKVALEHFYEGRVTKELSDIANTMRMSIRDLHEMQRQAAEAEERRKEKEQSKTNDLIRVTEHGSAMESLETILREFHVGAAA